MTEMRSTELQLSSARRQETIDRLMEHFANDVIPMEEFERRLDFANQARTEGELQHLLADLPAAGPTGQVASPLPTVRRTRAVASPEQVRDTGFIIGILGGGERTGRWIPARKNYVMGVLGGAKLDLREALLGPGVTEVNIFAMCGGVEILVPPGLSVEVDGLAIMGGFSNHSEAPMTFDPDEPFLRVRGLAIMGGAEVQVRLRGETKRQARKRRKLERSEARKQLPSGPER